MALASQVTHITSHKFKPIIVEKTRRMYIYTLSKASSGCQATNCTLQALQWTLTAVIFISNLFKHAERELGIAYCRVHFWITYKMQCHHYTVTEQERGRTSRRWTKAFSAPQFVYSLKEPIPSHPIKFYFFTAEAFAVAALIKCWCRCTQPISSVQSKL